MGFLSRREPTVLRSALFLLGQGSEVPGGTDLCSAGLCPCGARSLAGAAAPGSPEPNPPFGAPDPVLGARPCTANRERNRGGPGRTLGSPRGLVWGLLTAEVTPRPRALRPSGRSRRAFRSRCAARPVSPRLRPCPRGVARVPAAAARVPAAAPVSPRLRPCPRGYRRPRSGRHAGAPRSCADPAGTDGVAPPCGVRGHDPQRTRAGPHRGAPAGRTDGRPSARAGQPGRQPAAAAPCAGPAGPRHRPRRFPRSPPRPPGRTAALPESRWGSVGSGVPAGAPRGPLGLPPPRVIRARRTPERAGGPAGAALPVRDLLPGRPPRKWFRPAPPPPRVVPPGPALGPAQRSCACAVLFAAGS
ncbi:nascent polypeptide-associated complex subunit alpha, muscle-specific form-like [Mustela putorius furo]|uniref:Nascent polypeptide-associated complex subunit alpha, muscle-specific form-like n=1 Tax=Mustela putorius furo TaxID=9669 RepID=A0A8U0V8T9_MUSPF|nr:nascent polypeptide-associated complex subunit alpha, muscle-specific form-like [Mustela putorius furo]